MPGSSSSQSQIASRLRLARDAAKLSQAELAGRIGLSRDQLASIETGRVPLRFWPAWKACATMDLNPIWLAIGRSSSAPFVSFDFENEERAVITERTSFAEGFELIARAYEAHWEYLSEVPKDSLAINASTWQVLVDSVVNTDRMAAMSRWTLLRKRLQKLAAEYGAKSRIARAFGVSRQAVDHWLNGSAAPAAETALRLLEWVAAEEAKQKTSAGSVSDARPAPSTRVRKSKHEKPNRDPKKK
jgi:transcriptional regulator with XRE-family HTH domain